MNYENKKDCHLMVWEENPNKRNINNVVKFNLLKPNEIEIGDKLRCKIGNGRFSCYEITEIIENRQSSISNMNYITAKTNHFFK